MYHFFVTPEQVGASTIRIEGGDVNHIRNVLRMEPGEQITVSTGEDGMEYRCEIRELAGDCVTAKILQVEEADTELPSRICLFQGLPKGDKMELIIQKAVELGVFEIVPVATKRAVVKLDAKKEESKRRRWNAIAESAAKQSKRRIIPQVRPVMSFAQAVQCAAATYEKRFIPYERAEGMDETRRLFRALQPGETVALFIGPEGGFDEQEIALAKEHEIVPITLGRRILRTETAGMAVLAALMLQLERG